MPLKTPSPWAIAVVVLATILGFVDASAQSFTPPPTPSTLVNDYADLLSGGEEQLLEQKLVAYDDSTSTQIAVVILPTLSGTDAGQAATEIGRAWGVGQSGADNGVVLLVSVDDRKLFIATGYGTESVLPDIIAGRIIRNILTPHFREGHYFAGIDEATSAIMAAAAGEFEAIGDATDGDDPVLPALLFLFILFTVIILMAKSDGSGPRGGWIVTSGNWSSGSGWSSGGSGFSGGGGFGGFGGGGFGGGGAGGGW